MRNLLLSLATLTLLSSGAYGMNLKCANGGLNLDLNTITSTNGFVSTKDKVLVAKGQFTEPGPTRSYTQTQFKDGKVIFFQVTPMVLMTIQRNFDFIAVVKHRTTSASGEWSTYEVPAGQFNDKKKGSTYLQVNNYNNTATIFKSANKNDTWKCK